MDEIKIKWYGHSFFSVEKNGYRIALDPFGDGTVPGYGPVRIQADQVLCSHGHGDHCGTECVEIRDSRVANPFRITELPSYHDDVMGTKRGTNTIRILDDGRYRIAHMGDIGCEPAPEQRELLLAVDVMLMPVGGFFTMEPEQVKRLVDELHPTTLIPMHYRTEEFGYGQIGTLRNYTKLCSDVTVYDRDYLVLPADLKPQTAVLT